MAVGRSWHPFKEHLWRSPAMTGTGFLRGGLTTRAEHRKDTVFPALCPCCRHMTSLGQAAPPAVISARGTYQPLITKIIRLHLQYSSQHRLWSGNRSPGLLLCEKGTDKQESALVSWKKRQEGSSAWLVRSDAWFSSALGLLYLHTCAQGELGRL